MYKVILLLILFQTFMTILYYCLLNHCKTIIIYNYYKSLYLELLFIQLEFKVFLFHHHSGNGTQTD